jgi:hypothetical protein
VGSALRAGKDWQLFITVSLPGISDLDLWLADYTFLLTSTTTNLPPELAPTRSAVFRRPAWPGERCIVRHDSRGHLEALIVGIRRGYTNI